MGRLDRRTKLVALGAAVLFSAGTAGSAAASGTGHQEKREAAALTGTAELYRSAGDDITFSFDAPSRPRTTTTR